VGIVFGDAVTAARRAIITWTPCSDGRGARTRSISVSCLRERGMIGLGQTRSSRKLFTILLPVDWVLPEAARTSVDRNFESSTRSWRRKWEELAGKRMRDYGERVFRIVR
jgi:hypothetical protein